MTAEVPHDHVRWYWRQDGAYRIEGWKAAGVRLHILDFRRIAKSMLGSEEAGEPPSVSAWWRMGGWLMMADANGRGVGFGLRCCICQDWTVSVPSKERIATNHHTANMSASCIFCKIIKGRL